MKKFKLIILLLALISLNACKHELEKPVWETDFLLPIMNSNLDIENLFSDTNVTYSTNEQGLVSLIFEQEFLDIDFDSLVKIDAIADEQTHTLDSASFEDVNVSDTLTLQEALNDIGLPIPNGTTLPSFTGINGAANEDTSIIDASQYFETMTLYRGTLVISIVNNFPTDISNISLTLLNSVNQSIIATFYFNNIASGTTATDSISIGGQTIDENLFAILHNMDINASSGPVVINYSDNIITNINIVDIGITEATAIFPEQQLTEKYKEHSFNLGQAQLKEISIKSGTATIYVLSTLPNGKMIYKIPSLTKDGIPFNSGEMLVPEAVNSNLTSFVFEFSDYILDLTGKDGRIGGDTINTIYTEAFTYIDSTGELVTINEVDSFYSFIEFDLKAKSAKGYLGQDSIKYGPEQLHFSVFNKIQADQLNLEQANMKFAIKNFIGADIDFIFNELSTENSSTSVSATQDQFGDNVIGKTYHIERASLNISTPPINPTYTEVIIDAANMLEILPTSIKSEVDFFINPDATNIMDNFLYPDYPTEASIELTIPLSIAAENLTLIDTVDFNLSRTNKSEITELYMIVNNGMPLESNIEIILLDEVENILDTLFKDQIILPAKTDANYLVIEPTRTVLTTNYEHIYEAKKAIINASFSTTSTNHYTKIYNDYKLEFVMSAKLKNKIGE